VQTRVPEDFKLLGVLERTFTTIKVKKANLKFVLVWFINLSFG